MNYRFRLETVLSYRHNLAELAQQKLSAAQIVLHNHQQQLKELTNERRDAIIAFEKQKKNNLSGTLFSWFMTGINSRELSLQTQHTIIASQKKVVETTRKELQEKIKAKKIMEKAKERDYQKYLKTLLDKEQQESDEQTILRFRTKKDNIT